MNGWRLVRAWVHPFLAPFSRLCRKGRVPSRPYLKPSGFGPSGYTLPDGPLPEAERRTGGNGPAQGVGASCMVGLWPGTRAKPLTHHSAQNKRGAAAPSSQSSASGGRLYGGHSCQYFARRLAFNAVIWHCRVFRHSTFQHMPPCSGQCMSVPALPWYAFQAGICHPSLSAVARSDHRGL